VVGQGSGMSPEVQGYAPLMADAMEDAALLCETAAAELDRAAAHCRTAATHFREREIPRAAAHAWAAFGHVRTAETSLEAQARTHAENSNPL
jgi:hypothetical protein